MRAKAKTLGIYFNGINIGIDCKCCNDRWSEHEQQYDGEYEDETRMFKQDEFDINEKFVTYPSDKILKYSTVKLNQSSNLTRPISALMLNGKQDTYLMA